jgi:hypothetical protein
MKPVKMKILYHLTGRLPILNAILETSSTQECCGAGGIDCM